MMKKLLLGSTALLATAAMVTPALAADPIKIGVGGYYTFYAAAGYVDSTYATNGTVTSYRGFDFIQEGEIHFTGQTKLDNGTTVGLMVELEAWNTNTVLNNQTVDEAFLFAFGDWGRLEVGGRDPGPYRMYYGTPSALIGWGFNQHNHAFMNASVMANNKAYRGFLSTTIAPQMQDNNRINYFTPRFAGLQIGVAYAPKMIPQIGVGAGGLATGPGVTSGTCGFSGPTNVFNCPTADYSWQDEVSVGVNYLNQFGDVKLALFGAYYYASFVPGNTPYAPSANTVTGANLAAWKQWVVGAQFGFSGFTLGGAIGWDNNGLGGNYYTRVDNDTRFYTVGAMYETGPWQLSAGWAGFRNTNGNGSATVTSIATGTQAQTFNTAAMSGVPGVNSTAFGGGGAAAAGGLAFGMETVDKYEVGANYALGPGVKLTGGFMYYAVSGPSNAVSGNSWTVLVGMDLRF